ncbi:transcriptional regulator SutA [Pseudomonas oryzihabitans]|uniref:transcriptional regulator SutA n=1 Tax=Pseudomonas oryzihabitans TaxID=47885 RepID=UPI0028941615|nr:transcriptional regulator SutA [Pseudomonas oryzihabitans]MDT3722389.1 transcriptional regulator SutA [Pseudomonas oryzihabitans]
MSDEELEQDDLETGAEEEGDNEEFAAATEDAESEESSDSEAPAAGGKAKKKREAEPEELPSVEAKQREREALERAMQEFLARGGKVQEIDANVVADPPKKPDSKYGSRPI